MITKTSPKVVIAYENFGPYHIARLSYLANILNIHAIEFFRKSKTYSWASINELSFNKTTICGNDNLINNNDKKNILINVLNKVSPQIVFIPGWSSPMSLIMLKWCNDNKIPCIVMSDSQFIDFPRKLYKEYVKKTLIKACDGAFVAGSRHAEYIKKLGFVDKPIELNYDIVDNEYFNSGVNQPASNYILCCARLVDKKNISILIKAYNEFVANFEFDRKKLPNLVIVGDGPNEQMLKNLINELNITDKVFLKGFVDYQFLPNIYKNADFFILPSISEQWGLVVNEAMAAGLAVLVSNKAGCVPELVHDGLNGYSFDPNNVEYLTELISKFYLSPERTQNMGLQSLNIISKYTLAKHSESVCRLVEAVRVDNKKSILGNIIMQLLIKRYTRNYL